jgi:hypothetical protein
MQTTRLLALVVLGATLAGCGTTARGVFTPRVAAQAVAQAKKSPLKDDSDHAQMNAIVKSVLDGMFAELVQTSDENKDGAVSRDEYAKGRSNDAAWLFQATFDENRDGVITKAEFDKAMATGAPVEAYHKFTEEAMDKAITPYMKDKNFDQPKVRSYLTRDLGLTADFLQLFGLMDKLDLNKDGKVLSAPGEGPAFLLTFAKPQMQKAVGLAVQPIF